jgi:dihydrofolate reductase
MSRGAGGGLSGMPNVTCQISVSLDGFAAGPDQSREHPLGVGGERLHTWFFTDEPHPADRALGERLLEGNGAYVMGRRMFGGGPGAWDPAWRGWWGEEPPYHAPVFVLTHHPREPLAMQGGTTFHFVTDGLAAALALARAAAGDRDVAIAGGASTVQQALRAGVLDELHLHVVPVVLGAGERLLDDVGDPALEPVDVVASPAATHVRYRVGG